MTRLADELKGEGNADMHWQGPRIGTCDEPVDKLRITFGRVRFIPDLIVGFDGIRGGWVIGASFYTEDGNDFEFRELAFVSEESMKEERFMKESLNAK